MNETDEDGFVDLAPPPKFAGKPAEIVISTSQMRSGPVRLLLNLSRAAAAALGSGARVRTAWNAKAHTLRVVAVDDGPFEWTRPTRGDRFLLRLPLPDGVLAKSKLKEPCPHRFEGNGLFCIVPPALRVPPPKVDAIAQAKALVPAPSFSGPGRSR